MTQDGPAVSVALPTRDRWALALRALRGALAQRGASIEVVLVDDGSAEEPPPAPELDDPRVRVVRHLRSRGVAAARNTAIAHASGEWVAFLDDDDFWAPGTLALQLAEAEAAGADFGWTSQAVVDEDLEVLEVWPAVPADGIERALLEVNRIGGPSSVIARRATLERLGGFDERLSLLADWDMWLRLAAECRASAVPAVVTAYSLHTANMHLREMDVVLWERAYVAAKHADVGAAHGVEVGGHAFWEWVALGYRRATRRRRAARTYLRAWRGSHRARDLVRAGGVFLGERAMTIGAAARAELPSDGLDWIADLAATPDRGGSVRRP